MMTARSFKGAWSALAALAMAGGAVPAAAQMSDSYTFIKAVRDRDGNKATEMLDKAGTTIVNTRDRDSAETALIIVTKNRDTAWLGFLLARGAKTELRDKEGSTALTVASRIGLLEGARLLLQSGAAIDLPNGNGETPLILAVEQHDAAMVRMLLQSGANPRIADRIAGKSALDYARDDARSVGILRMLNEAKPRGPVAGPVRP